MAWGHKGRPRTKMCRGYKRAPHEMFYDKDFPKQKRKLKDGTIVEYATSLCRPCKNRFNRDKRRQQNLDAGKATRPQDVPWKRYQLPWL